MQPRLAGAGAEGMATRQDLLECLDSLLRPEAFSDYCPNGLQVEGRERIESLVTGVTASQALIEQACASGADALLVHHGYFWRNEAPVVTGMKARRLRALLEADVSLFAYHLPLDAHDEVGNNVQLAKRLDFDIDGMLVPGEPAMGRTGRLRHPCTASELARQLEAQLARPIVAVGPEEERLLQTVGWCTGAGQQFIEQAARLGLDAFLSGEISEPTAHVARECGVHYFACGHHATERYGVQALGERAAAQLGLSHRFVDMPNPA